MADGNYAQLERALADARALTDAPEAHGTLAGALCAAEAYRLEDWLGEILPDGRADPDTTRELQEVFEATHRALHATDMGFRIALPPDDRPLDERADALGHWCQGFLYGLGTSAIKDLPGLPGDAGEIVRDLTEITRIGVDQRESEQNNETAYAELVEFVRVGVQLLFEELERFRVLPPPSREALH